MPTYVYRRLGPDGRPDGTTFELQQRISEPALTTDPETGQPVERVISGAGLVFKGTGFYLTDYARKGGAPEKGEAKGETKGEAKGDGKPEAKPAAPASEASASTSSASSPGGSSSGGSSSGGPSSSGPAAKE